MDSAIDSAFLHIQRELETITNEERFLVGISGIPGSGKSCKCPFEQHILSYVSVAFTSKLFDKLINSGMNAGVISMDGWHYTRDELSKFPDPEAAFARRGAPHTFDTKSYTDFVKSLKKTPRDFLQAPTFSHSLKDPTPAGVAIDTHTQIVILEGNYVLLNDPKWKEAANLLNIRFWIDLDENEARSRLVKRHLASGICENEEDAYRRVETNDIQNGRYVRANLIDETKVIESIDDVKYRV
ncbi:P-loop containing nucleoside triphosphate hydrolase protein [Wallemia mellicola]|uniref:P-loop containing nucleoside triphosphate hydrolase protein n=1 Tax=Wallemia mellicola TaxID=1708541 RepID=A0A4T0T871_9BASI|nr:P-loop containing nucleoside triphosphate hydrolase protein [Wallemia mellicola]TIC07447.1 P-loop containing nucleoside triphosphate hydrolase protein [Wallemia mellicola]TIC60710.1 P-loop containing nucleoside triphosphate hydrolase protein [Wallemia mellicola]